MVIQLLFSPEHKAPSSYSNSEPEVCPIQIEDTMYYHYNLKNQKLKNVGKNIL